MQLGGTSDGATLETLARRDHEANLRDAAQRCPSGLATTPPTVDAGAGCSLLSDPCYLCIGVTCGVAFRTCNGDAMCQGQSAIATACVCDAQAAGNDAVADACINTFTATGQLADAFGTCLAQCTACGF